MAAVAFAGAARPSWAWEPAAARRQACPAGGAAAAAGAWRAPAVRAAQCSQSYTPDRRLLRRPAIAEVETAATTSETSEPTPLPQLPLLDDSYESTCTFTDFANWLIPGRVLLGRYPFVEPSRCRSRDMGEKQLQQLLSAGVTTFVCLQAELPEQAAMRIGGVDGFLPYRPAATLLATAMSPPPSIEEIAALRTPELDRYLPPRRRSGPAPWQQRRRLELDFCHCPIVDLGLPDPDRLRLLLADITQRLEKGECLYVHCWGGRGRAGLVGACLLAHLYGLTAKEALERVQRSFDTRKDGGRRSPETDEQHAFVVKFIAGAP